MPLPGSNTGGLTLEPYCEEATTQMAIHLLTPMHRRCLAKWAHRSIGLAQDAVSLVGHSCSDLLLPLVMFWKTRHFHWAPWLQLQLVLSHPRQVQIRPKNCRSEV